MSGAVHPRTTCCNDTVVTTTSRGALETDTFHGAAEITPDAGPVPIELTALTRSKYEDPLVSPVIVVVSDVDTPSSKTE